MAHKSLYYEETLHWVDASWQFRNKIQSSSTISPAGSPATIVLNNGVNIQCGVATLVNGVVQIWSGDQGAIVLNTKSRIGFSPAAYDNVDVSMLSWTNRVNGLAGTATFTVVSKSDENFSFTWWIFN